MLFKQIILTSILCILNSVLLFSNEPDSLFRVRLDSGIHSLEKGNFENGLNIFNQIIYEAKEQDNYKFLVLATLNKGAMYFRLTENEEALNYYFKSLDLAEQHKLDSLYNTIYNNIGIIYSSNNDTDKAREYFSKALEISKQLDETYRIGINLINLGNLEVDEENYIGALKYLEKAEKIFEEADNKKNLAAIYSIIGIIYQNQQRFLLAKNNHLRALRIEENYDDKMYLSMNNLHLANSYYSLNMTDSSLFYSLKSLKMSEEIHNKDNSIKASKLIANSYFAIGDLQEASNYYNLCLNWKDSLIAEKSQKWVSEMQMKYEFGKQQKEIEFLERRNKLSRIIWLLTFASIFITSLFLVYSYRNRIIKSKQRNALLKKDKEMNELELQKTEAENKCLLEEMKANEEISLMEQEKLKQEIEHKDRELTSNALHVVNKNAILQDIQDQVKTISCEDINDTQNIIRTILRTINTNVNLDDDWDTFKMHFEEVHGEFFNKIQEDYPTLSQNDLRLCAYMLINLNPKEIAQILNIAPDSVRKRKQRLKEKLDLEAEQEITNILLKYKYAVFISFII